MSAAPASLATWLVSAHPRGEVLTIEERGPSLTLWLLGQPEGFSAPEVQGWLHDVAGVAHESAAQDTSPQPIPVLLRHALSGLLFSHSEMWAHAPGPGPCSVAFTSGEDGIGIGWIGEAEVSVLLDNQMCDVRWVLVRDDHGREARAWSVEAGRDVRVTLRWQLRPGDADSPRVLLEARTRSGGMTGEPAAVVPAARFVPPARRKPPAEPVAEPPVAAVPAAPELDPGPIETAPIVTSSIETPSIEPVALESSWIGPSVEALYEADLPEVEPPPVSAVDAVESPAQEISVTSSAIEEPVEIVPDAREVALPRPGTIPSTGRETFAVPPEPVPGPDPDSDPARPSSGIARWLTRNFGWIRRGRQAEPDPVPPPAVPIPEPVAEQQEMMEIVASPAEPAVADIAPADDAPPVAPLSQRDQEDELARTAVALAEVLGGWDKAPASERRDAPIEVIAEPSRIFEVLPEQIPPTPEPGELTARTEAPAADPREIALPVAEPAASAEVASVAPPVAVTVAPRLPSFVRPPVAPPESETRLEIDPHARLELEPALPAPPSSTQEFDPHERSITPLEVTGVADTGPPTPSAVEAPAIPDDAVPAHAEPSAHAEPPAHAEPSATEAEFPAHAAEPDAALQPEGVLAAAPSARRRPALHPDWPAENEIETDHGRKTRTTWMVLGAVITVLFGIGWLVGSLQGARQGAPAAGRGPLALLGIKGPTFKTEVRSQPDGAWILVDGTPTQKRTPMTLELPPGRHDITLSFGQWGQAVYPVEGKKNQTRHVDGTLWGSLEVGTPELGVVIAVAVDGRPRGFAPVVVDSLAPGPHQVRFSGPGMPSWGQTVEIHVAQRAQVLARTVRSPATGVLQVRANRTEAGESEPFSGAKVWIDGELRGATPLTVELPRGPHSVRVELGDERLPVQMIDLPGGNQRFATFELGTGEEHPEIRLDAPARIEGDRPVVVSATLTEVAPREVREMWLHVQGSDGTWSRYPMARLQGQLSPVGAVAFPVEQIGPSGRTRWYASAVTTQGDEFHSEIQTIRR